MTDPPLSDPSLDWIAGALFLWLGAAGWTTAVAAHLGLSEWRWFAFALATGPVAWVAVYLRLRRRRSPSREAAAASPPPESLIGR